MGDSEALQTSKGAVRPEAHTRAALESIGACTPLLPPGDSPFNEPSRGAMGHPDILSRALDGFIFRGTNPGLSPALTEPLK